METTIVYWGYMEALQCSSFWGLVWFFGLGFLLGLPKGTTLEGLGAGLSHWSCGIPKFRAMKLHAVRA